MEFMRTLFILISLISFTFSQVIRIGTIDTELSEYKSEVFESGLIFGLGYDFTLFDIPTDLELFYSSNNFLNENGSYHVQLQVPLSFRFYLKDKIFLRAGVQYDIPLDFRIFDEDFSKYTDPTFSLIYGFGVTLKFAEDSNIFIEVRYISPQQNYLNVDDEDRFGSLKQFNILLGFKL